MLMEFVYKFTVCDKSIHSVNVAKIVTCHDELKSSYPRTEMLEWPW